MSNMSSEYVQALTTSGEELLLTSGHFDNTTSESVGVEVWTIEPGRLEVRWSMLGLVVLPLLSLVLHISVLLIVSCSHKLQNTFYDLLASLATVDLLCVVTAMPTATSRALLGEVVPDWLCSTWLASYLFTTCLRLSHLIVAALFTHLRLSSPLSSLLRHRFLPILYAWLLPIILLLPYLSLQLISPEDSTHHCVPLTERLVYAGLVPAFLLPSFIMVLGYIRARCTVEAHVVIVEELQNDPNSDFSSNGFVTYEDSESEYEGGQDGGWLVERERGRESEESKKDREDSISLISTSQTGRETRIDNTEKAHDMANGVSPAISSVTSIEACIADETQTAQKTNDSDSLIIHPDLPPEAQNKERVEEVLEEQVESDVEKTTREVNEGSERRVVHVKGKSGKEALNEPIHDDEVQLDWEVDNPAFEPDTEDFPLAAAIKMRRCIEESSDEQEAVDKPCELNSPTSSTTSSTGNLSEGHKSILKREGSKRYSNKSVKFDLPQRKSSRWKRNTSRLLSCRYKNGKDLKVSRTETENGVVHSGAGPLEELNTSKVLKLAESNLAKLNEFHYLAQAQSTQSEKLRRRIRQSQTQLRLLFLLFLLLFMFNLPYMVTTSLYVFTPQILDIPERLFILFEWLAYMPSFIYPFLYLASLSEFRKALLSPCSNAGTLVSCNP